MPGKVEGYTSKIISEAAEMSDPYGCACSDEICLSDVLEMWMCSKRLSVKGATEYKYRYMIDRHIAPDIGDIPIRCVTYNALNKYVEYKLSSGRVDGSGGLSPSYVKTLILILQSSVKFAALRNMCRPVSFPLYKPQSEKKDLTILSFGDQMRLERYLKTGTDAARLGVLISLHTGMRIGEICALSWNDVDINGKIIRVRHTISREMDTLHDGTRHTRLVIAVPKTKSSVRDIPVSTGLMPYLLRMRTYSVSDYVISENSTFVSPRSFEYRFHSMLRDCGIENINYHALRHTFATRCIEAGVDVKSLSEILGHANVGITMNTYVHSSMEMKRRQIEKLTRLMM